MSAELPRDTVQEYGPAGRIDRHYQIIGGALLAHEKQGPRMVTRPIAARSIFREGVAFVPNEVLQSYLDDLLDLQTSNQQLHIERQFSWLGATPIALTGLLVSFAVGLFAAKNGASLPVALFLTVGLTLPFACIWHLSPQTNLSRRLRFAQLVSHEIARRRGDNGDHAGQQRPRLRIWNTALSATILACNSGRASVVTVPPTQAPRI